MMSSDQEPTMGRTDSTRVPDPTKIRVVVVDDAGDFRHLMRAVLERAAGFEVVGEARNGLEGIAAVRKHDPQLVLLDISMPTMGGFEALPLIRDVCPKAAIVVLSTFHPSTLKNHAVSLGVQARCLGADGYIQKGQRLNVFLSQVQAVIDATLHGDRHG